MDTCFLKNGHPSGFKKKGKSQNLPQSSSQYKANNVFYNAHAPTEDSPCSSFGFTQEEIQSIYVLLQQSKPNPTVNSITTSPLAMNSHSSSSTGNRPNIWILDTGVTKHITFTLDSFTSFLFL
ncbi:unnamed protein product [Vicia faba]|uniref:Uncharacterized protein n=1 Tax=Vicia faba TaxID=3906 RepID=A0AAV1BB13_VICFA|nr:unnamed protein product [Vicia faba]